MVKIPVTETVDKAVDTARVAQLIALVKENQLITALVLFCLWQSGAILSAQSYATGVMC